MPVAATTPATAASPKHHKRAAAKRPDPPATVKDDAKTEGPVTVVTHTVRDIAEVFPGWAKVLIAALGSLLLAAGLLILLAALRNRRLRALSARLLDEVGILSTALLPAIPERVGSLAVSVAYRPAEGLAAGGDFYDVFPLDNGRVGIILGDVSGHGRESLGPATMIRHMVRSYLEAGLAPRAALGLASKVLDDHDGDDFATVIAAVHDPNAATLSYASAGHPPPFVRGPGAHQPVVAAASPPVGVNEPTGLRQTTVAVAAGTLFCFFTDGLFEARRGERILGMPALSELVDAAGEDATAEQIVTRVARATDAMPDDVAVCLVRVPEAPTSAGTVRVEELEIVSETLNRERVARFLRACDVEPGYIRPALDEASAFARAHGGVVLRVRITNAKSEVDLVPTGATRLVPVRAVTA